MPRMSKRDAARVGPEIRETILKLADAIREVERARHRSAELSSPDRHPAHDSRGEAIDREGYARAHARFAQEMERKLAEIDTRLGEMLGPKREGLAGALAQVVAIQRDEERKDHIVSAYQSLFELVESLGEYTDEQLQTVGAGDPPKFEKATIAEFERRQEWSLLDHQRRFLQFASQDLAATLRTRTEGEWKAQILSTMRNGNFRASLRKGEGGIRNAVMHLIDQATRGPDHIAWQTVRDYRAYRRQETR